MIYTKEKRRDQAIKMNEDEEEDQISVLRSMASNKDIRRGFLCLGIAVILAFTAVIPQVNTDINKGKVTPDSGDHYIEFWTSPYMVRNSTLKLEYKSNSTPEVVNISIENEDFNVVRNISIDTTESVKIDLTKFDSETVYLDINISEGSLYYTQRVRYTTHPYRVLSLPAAFLTILGMVYAFKGKGAILAAIQEKKEQKEKSKKEEERESKAEKEGEKEETQPEESEEEETKGDQEGGTSREDQEKRADGDHIQFMGTPGFGKDK